MHHPFVVVNQKERDEENTKPIIVNSNERLFN